MSNLVSIIMSVKVIGVGDVNIHFIKAKMDTITVIYKWHFLHISMCKYFMISTGGVPTRSNDGAIHTDLESSRELGLHAHHLWLGRWGRGFNLHKTSHTGHTPSLGSHTSVTIPYFTLLIQWVSDWYTTLAKKSLLNITTALIKLLNPHFHFICLSTNKS